MQHRNVTRIPGGSALLMFAFALVLMLVSAPAPGAALAVVDISVANIEITQAIQTTTNTIPLVAQRSTAVRVTVGVSGSPIAVPGVNGRLHVFVGGSAITPPAGIPPINAPFTAPLAPVRANENHTLNFELPAPTGITASSDVDFQVVLNPASGETNTANNTGTVNNLTFSNRTTPTIFYTSVNYAGLGLPDPALIQPGVGDAFVRGIFPINDADPALYQLGLFPSLNFNLDSNSNGILNWPGDGDQLLAFLASCRQLIVDNGLGATNNTFLYGWLAGNPTDHNGLGELPGFTAYGNTDPTRHQRTFAHELGHNFGLGHGDGGLLTEVGWDVGARLPNNPAGNNVLGRAKPTTLNDIMTPGLLSNQAWVGTTNYQFFFNSLPAAKPAARDILQLVERAVVVQGIFNVEGQQLIQLEPSFRFPWVSEASVPQPEANFIVEVEDELGEIYRVPFQPTVGDDAGFDLPGFFEVVVAIPPDVEIASIQIVDGSGGNYGSLRRSEPPVLTVLSPSPGDELGEQTLITWEISDPDTPLDDLLYQIAYSPDGGRSWVPLAVDVPGSLTEISVDTQQIQQSVNGVIAVFVSDGTNTTSFEVPGLTTLAAIYPAPPERLYLPVIFNN